MKKQWFTRLAALLLAALLVGMPLARAEDVPQIEVEAVVEDGAQLGSVAEDAPEVETGRVEEPVPEDGDIALDVAVDPLVPPATETGDTGLWVEYEAGTEQAAVELGEIDLPVGGEGPAQTAPEEAQDGAEDGGEAEPEPVEQGLGVYARTQAEIQAFADAHPAYTSQVNIYAIAATDDPYKVGYLSDVNQRSALNLVNQMRYIAGLDGNLTLYPEREEMMAAASLVLRLHGGLSHYPPRAEAISGSEYDALYALGYSGAGRANIAMGYTATSAILAYMSDSDDVNIEDVGHRRWILYPPIGKTVTAANGRFSAMYVRDQSAAGGQTRVAWPAQQMPVQYFSAEDPWSVSFDMQLDAAQIEVDLTRRWDNRTWHFSEAASDGFFKVDNRAFGQRGCVIFRPSGLDGVMIGDVFDVAVTDHEHGTVTRYSVSFFSLDTTASAPLSRPEITAVKTDVGNVISWAPVERAVGYYVCRRAEDELYAIIDDVQDTTYLDDAVDGDVLYYYQVYPHTNCVTSPLVTGVAAKAPQPDSVKMSVGKTAKLYVDEKLQLEAVMTPSYAETGVFWYSTNERVAKVDQKGLVKPVKAGWAKIYAVTDNNKTALVKVHVLALPKPTAVTLNKKGTVRLYPGKTLQLKATLSPKKAASKLKWSSSDSKVVRVSQKGLIKALKIGKATITVKTANGKTASVKVVVPDPSVAVKVQLDRTGTVALKKGGRLKLKATLTPDTAKTALKWTSSNPKVAKVSKNGVVTALKAGTATITVTTGNGKKASVKVRVKK